MSTAVDKKTLWGHPVGVYVLAFTELWERFSFYGVRGLLVIYMATELKFSDPRTYAIFGTYATLVYATPVLGGYLADKVIGFQRAILWGAVIIVTGHICMAFAFIEGCFYMGLALIITGTGLFKSNVSTMVGLMYNKGDQRRDSGYTIFYIGINIGGLLAPLICGHIGYTYGWHYGFGLASIGMLLGVAVLLKCRKYFGEHGLRPAEAITDLKATTRWTVIGAYLATPLVAWIVFIGDEFMRLFPYIGAVFLAYILVQAFSQSTEGRRSVLLIIGAMVLLTLTSAFGEQEATLISLFLERNVDRTLFGMSVAPPVFQVVNPCVIIIFGSLISQLWLWMARSGREIYAGTKFSLAFILITAAFGIFYYSCASPDSDFMVSAWVVVGGLVLLALGEILSYPIALSLCSQLSPLNLQGVMMGAMMMSVAFSQYLASTLATVAAVPDEALELGSKAASLEIYGDTFFKMTMLAIACFVISVFFAFILNRGIRKHG